MDDKTSAVVAEPRVTREWGPSGELVIRIVGAEGCDLVVESLLGDVASRLDASSDGIVSAEAARLENGRVVSSSEAHCDVSDRAGAQVIDLAAYRGTVLPPPPAGPALAVACLDEVA